MNLETSALVAMPALGVGEFERQQQIGKHLQSLLDQCGSSEAAAALVPWFCDALPSAQSRKSYFGAMKRFFAAMQQQGVHPFAVTGDHVRLYKAVLREGGHKPNTICQALTVIRGVYQQFGKKGIVSWDTASDIQAITSPQVDKNTTPCLSETEACALLHAPDTETVLGIRDHALLFTFIKTACRSSAIGRLMVGDLERTDTEWHVVVKEKRKKVRRMHLLEAAAPVMRWLQAGGIVLEDKQHPLFTPLERDGRTPKRAFMSQRLILDTVKKYAEQAGIQVSRSGGRGVCTHSIRSSVLNNALDHGAPVEDVQLWAGHASIQTTQQYIRPREKGAENAARRCMIR